MDERSRVHRFSALYFVKAPKTSKRQKIIGVGGRSKTLPLVINICFGSSPLISHLNPDSKSDMLIKQYKLAIPIIMVNTNGASCLFCLLSK